MIEWSKTSFSVYARTGEAVPGGAESPGLMPPTAGRLSWRKVLQFVQSHDLTAISAGDPRLIDVHGVQAWQREVIVAAMLRLPVVPFLARRSEKELKTLYHRLDGFLSAKSLEQLRRLAAAAASASLARKSLVEIARLVGSSDPLDITRLACDCEAYAADQHAKQVLAKHRYTPAPPTELFLSLLYRQRPRSPRLRAGLFELWLRADPKPKGGIMSVGHMDDELPVLDWLLRERVAEIFQVLIESRPKELQEFVSWFLGAARRYARYFTRRHKFDSFVVYAYGRTRFALWARLAKEVQDAATSLEILVPEEVRLPAMPRLEEPTRAFSVVTPARIRRQRLKEIQNQVSDSDKGED